MKNQPYFETKEFRVPVVSEGWTRFGKKYKKELQTSEGIITIIDFTFRTR
jgi:hypothetical protein